MAALVLLAVAGTAIAQPCAGCSCRGGPGFRAANGKCVGWKQLARVCGVPHTTRCSDERPVAIPVAGGEDTCGRVGAAMARIEGVRLIRRDGDRLEFSHPATSSFRAFCMNTGGFISMHSGVANPPQAYFDLFGKGGQAVTGLPMATIKAAAAQCHAASVKSGHSAEQALPGGLVTCLIDTPDNTAEFSVQNMF